MQNNGLKLQPTNQPTNQTNNQPTNQSINEAASQPTIQLVQLGVFCVCLGASVSSGNMTANNGGSGPMSPRTKSRAQREVDLQRLKDKAMVRWCAELLQGYCCMLLITVFKNKRTTDIDTFLLSQH